MIFYLKQVTRKLQESQFGNDRQRGKCTYVTKYGLDTAIKMLDDEVKEAIYILEEYKIKDDFLVNLAEYIKNRNK